MEKPQAKKLFGTDGIRGRANHAPLVPVTITRIGQAVAAVLGRQQGDAIVVGTDTRISGDMIKAAIIAGICSHGMNVWDAGVIPTPAVAFLTAASDAAAAGIVISASHKPAS